MNLTHKSLDKRALFNKLQDAVHVKSVEGEAVKVIGVVVREEISTDGEAKLAAYAITDDKALYGSAASYINTLNELANIFEDDILGAGLDVKFATKEVGRNGNTIWFATLA